MWQAANRLARLITHNNVRILSCCHISRTTWRSIRGLSTHSRPDSGALDTKLYVATGEPGKTTYLKATQRFLDEHSEFQAEAKNVRGFFKWCEEQNGRIHPGLALAYYVSPRVLEAVVKYEYTLPENVTGAGQQVITVPNSSESSCPTDLPRYNRFKRGLFTTQPIEKGAYGFQIPLSMVLGAPTESEDTALGIDPQMLQRLHPSLRKGLSASLRMRAALELFRPLSTAEREAMELHECYLPAGAAPQPSFQAQNEAETEPGGSESSASATILEDHTALIPENINLATWFDLMPRAPLAVNSLSYGFGEFLRHPSKSIVPVLNPRDEAHFIRAYQEPSPDYTVHDFTSRIYSKFLGTLESIWQSCRMVMSESMWANCPRLSLVLTRAVNLEQAVGGYLPPNLVRSITSWFTQKDWNRISNQIAESSGNQIVKAGIREGSGVAVIVPFMDMANHAQPEDANLTVDLAVDEETLMKRVQEGKAKTDPQSGEPELTSDVVYICAQARRAINPGEELTICYNRLNLGDLSNAGSTSLMAARDSGSWVTTHGFVPRDNPGDYIQFTPKEISLILKSSPALVSPELRSKLITVQLEHGRSFEYVQQFPEEIKLTSQETNKSNVIDASAVLQLCFAFRAGLDELSSAYGGQTRSNVKRNKSGAYIVPSRTDVRMASLLLLEFATATWRTDALIDQLRQALLKSQWWNTSDTASNSDATGHAHEKKTESFSQWMSAQGLPQPEAFRKALEIEDESPDFEAFVSDPWVSDARLVNEFAMLCTIRGNSKRIVLRHYEMLHRFGATLTE